MKKIIMIGKMNEMLKNINDFLSRFFRMQLCTENTQNTLGMLKVVNPDLILISLVGFYDNNSVLFDRIAEAFPITPVITIGTENEKKSFLKYYNDESQFEHLIRPIENSDIFTAICKRLGLSEKEVRANEINRDDNRVKILIVDDDMSTLRTTKEMLDNRYNVTLANSGMKAMTSIGKNRPDIILLDYEMPVCDGRQTLEMIRADEDLKDIPVIFLTGVNDREHIKAVLALKPARYLLKPATAKTLIDTIEYVIAELLNKAIEDGINS